jgi:hypothetical protein
MLSTFSCLHMGPRCRLPRIHVPILPSHVCTIPHLHYHHSQRRCCETHLHLIGSPAAATPTNGHGRQLRLTWMREGRHVTALIPHDRVCDVARSGAEMGCDIS